MNVLLACALPVLSVLTACGSNQTTETNGTEESGSKNPNTVNDISQTPAQLTVFSTGAETEESFEERFGKPIRKRFPNYQIHYIRSQKGSMLPELLAAGTTIDLYYDTIGNFANGLLANKLEYDMSDLIKQRGIDLNRYDPTLIDAMRQLSGGKIYGLPVFNNNLVLYYNKAIFDKFGVPYPKDGMTWDEANELARKLNRSEGGKQYLGLAVSPTHMLRMNPFSLSYIDPKSEKPTIASDSRWIQLYKATMIDPAQNNEYKNIIAELKNKLPYRDALLADQYLAMFVFQSEMPFTSDVSPIDWDVVSLPTFKELPGVGSQPYPIYFSVTAMSKAKEAAAEVIKFLGSDEYQMEQSKLGKMTVLVNDAVKRAYGQDTKFKGKNLGAAFYNKFAPISFKSVYDVALETAYLKDIGVMAKGETDINTAFRTAEEAANKAIADAKSK